MLSEMLKSIRRSLLGTAREAFWTDRLDIRPLLKVNYGFVGQAGSATVSIAQMGRNLLALAAAEDADVLGNRVSAPHCHGDVTARVASGVIRKNNWWNVGVLWENYRYFFSSPI